MRSLSRIVLGIALSASVATPARASEWRWGVRGGLNLASIRGEFADLVGPKTQMGVVAGGFIQHPLTGPVGVETDLLYVQKGFRLEGEETDDAGNPIGTRTDHVKLQYLEVPILVRVTLPSLGSVEPYVLAGPTLGIGLEARIEPDPGPSFSVRDDLERFDFGIAGGLGARLLRGPVHLELESRYGTGFRDLWDIPDNLESINQGFSFTVALSRSAGRD
jgi:hypothetical protein